MKEHRKPEPTVYLSPEKVSCPTCGAKPDNPCTRISGEPISHWHWMREQSTRA